MIKGPKLGEGTYGIVYEATSPGGSKRAVKRNLIEPEIGFIGSMREMHLLNELRNHPHIVNVVTIALGDPFSRGCMSPLRSHGQKDDKVHFIFERADGDFHSLLYKQRPTFAQIRPLMVHLLLAIEYLHAKEIIHRDIKPSNLLTFGGFDKPGGLSIKLCDLGLAKPYTRQGPQTPKVVTSWYRAPEVALGDPHYDYKSDMWSIGCVLFEMISRRAFLYNVPDDTGIIINRILGTLPQPVPTKLVKHMLREPIQITGVANPTHRLSFEQQLSFTTDDYARFKAQLGNSSIEQFCDLLGRLITFDPQERLTATEALNHPFFLDHKEYIRKVREKCPPVPIVRFEIPTHGASHERKWARDYAFHVFNKRQQWFWYTHRVLFQAIDLFDRYLAAMIPHVLATAPNSAESELRGKVHTKEETEIRFTACLYIAIKYFSTLNQPVAYLDLAPSSYRTEATLLVAEQFELGLIRDVLRYNIYRETPYEAAARLGHILNEIEVRDLLVFYGMIGNIERSSGETLYKMFQEEQSKKGK